MPEIFHETGVRQAFVIVQTGCIGLITLPHPAEFLVRLNHAQFRQIGGFQVRSLLLRFDWNSPVGSVQDRSGNHTLGVLLHVMEHGNYWHSAIFPDTLTGLTLLMAALRDNQVNFLDWENVLHPGTPAQCQVDELNMRIGADGMAFQVTGGAPGLMGLPPAPTQTSASRLLGRLLDG